MSLWCKLMRFLLNIADAVLSLVEQVVEIVVGAVVDVVNSVSDGLSGLLSKPIVLLGAGLGLLLFMRKDNKHSPPNTAQSSTPSDKSSVQANSLAGL